MKSFVIGCILALLPAVAAAQNFQGMTEADMQRMMQQAQKMQECMAKVDQAELEALEQKSNEFETEVKALCDAGKRDKAQKKAMAFAKDMADSEALKQMKECGEMMQGIMPPGQMPGSENDFDFSAPDGHVCDDM